MLAPIRMNPAYRCGLATPWGGSRLSSVYGKNIPDPRTGEALELSAIPGLNSVTDEGETLSALIEKHGGKLVGTAVKGEFPLLLKLLDADDALSVQVHPGDEYARRVEGKYGKTEAWVILKAEPGAQLVFGVVPGTTTEQLREASAQGSAVQALLQRVDVEPGDVLYIPSGMVHAIGKGIMLYEIQQSSDVTYRFYDWDRVDQAGRKRELHLDKALDVTDVTLPAVKAVPQVMQNDAAGVRSLLLKNDFFGLERLEKCNGMEIAPTPEKFGIITAIEDGCIVWDGGEMTLKAGQTAMLPADGYTLKVSGGHFLLTYPM
ncbi:MAG: class I mannose-6-phosphate isomerase [Clostridia bacterium]|nr:class I mannose-6-phosphate isomerase [Clostridia bacterium]